MNDPHDDRHPATLGHIFVSCSIVTVVVVDDDDDDVDDDDVTAVDVTADTDDDDVAGVVACVNAFVVSLGNLVF